MSLFEIGCLVGCLGGAALFMGILGHMFDPD